MTFAAAPLPSPDTHHLTKPITPTHTLARHPKAPASLLQRSHCHRALLPLARFVAVDAPEWPNLPRLRPRRDFSPLGGDKPAAVVAIRRERLPDAPRAPRGSGTPVPPVVAEHRCIPAALSKCGQPWCVPTCRYTPLQMALGQRGVARAAVTRAASRGKCQRERSAEVWCVCVCVCMCV